MQPEMARPTLEREQRTRDPRNDCGENDSSTGKPSKRGDIAGHHRPYGDQETEAERL